MYKDYNKMWEVLAAKKNWRDFILPKRTDKEFWQEGKEQAKFLQPFIGTNDIVVDLGCGIGRVIKFIEAKKKIGVDICQDFLDKIDDRSIIKIKSNGKDLKDIKDNSIDFLYSLMTFQHIRKEDCKFYMKDIYRVIRPLGKAFIQIPKFDSGYYKSSGFVNLYSEKELETLVSESPFKKYRIEQGNLVGYIDRNKDTCRKREYFLILTK